MPVPKKTTTKEVKLTKKKPIKKAVLSESKSRVVQNMFAKKPTVKPEDKLVAKTTVKVRVKPKTKTKPTVSKKSTKAEEMVSIPSTVSLRLQEKVQIYRLWYKDNFQVYAARTAQYGGYAFIVLGTLLTSFNYLLDKGVISTPAAVLCSDNSCREVPDAALPKGSPLIQFLSNLPEIITSEVDMQVMAENLDEFKLKLVSTQSGEVISLEPSQIESAANYRYLISPAALSPASYTVIAETKVNGISYKFTGSTFMIPEAELPVSLPEDTLATTSENLSSTTSSIENVFVTKDIEFSTSTELTSSLPISITYKESAESKYISIKTGTFLPRTVEVYSSVLGTTNPIFLGLATLVQGEWVFSLSALDLPKVDNLIFASFVDNSEKYTSNGIKFTPKYTQGKNQEDEVELEITFQKIVVALEGAGLDFSLRSTYFSKMFTDGDITFNQEHESQFASDSLREKITEAMVDNKTQIDLLLKHYASAVQVGNPYLINLADAQITVHYEKMAKTVAGEVGLDTLVPSITNIFALRFHALENTVVESESIFTTSSNSLLSKDTDKDGFSDYDEIKVYTSNPTTPDTDMDGVLDGVEVLVGKDPKQSDLTSFAYLEQNIEGTNSGEVVSITSVDPLVYKQQANSENLVFAVVRGKSIPNSFVYIFNYIESTVGVIKTSETGEFLYTLEKNLNDGTQEFIAVLVDNSGRVVSNSSKFSFVKTTNSFAAAVAANKQTYFEFTESKNFSLSANVIASITLVSFGFILLLLSQAVQIRKRQALETKTVKPA